MKSRAQFKSHPLHPILIVFPIAFFIGTLVFDAIGIVYDGNSLFTTARYIQFAGILGAVVSAIAGFIDYLFTVPPESSAKKRAAKHGLINSTVLVIFIISLVLKYQADPNYYIITAIELVGVVLMMIAGWMGGTLVHRNQIGVDIRYANAGKWKETYINEDKGEIEVGEEKELEINQMKLVHLKNRRIVLAKTEAGFVAFDDRCTHKGGSLASGSMMCNTVQCPWHGTQFDVKTGELKAGPAKVGIKTYEVMQKSGKLFVLVA